MSEAIKENSSLELYETAYKLHYIDGNISEACRIYKMLIDEFPNSNECGYAVIQLQKILANDVSDRVKTGKSTALQNIVMILCVLACIAAVAVSVGLLKKTNASIEALSLVSQALSLMYGGNDNDALELLNKAKTITRGTLKDPYLLSANIYMNMQQYDKAREEFETYQNISGQTDAVFKKMVTMKTEREKPDKFLPPMKNDSTQPSVGSAAASSEPSTATLRPEKPPAQPPAYKPKPKSEKPQRLPRQIRKGAPSSNPDSVSFF